MKRLLKSLLLLGFICAIPVHAHEHSALSNVFALDTRPPVRVPMQHSALSNMFTLDTRDIPLVTIDSIDEDIVDSKGKLHILIRIMSHSSEDLPDVRLTAEAPGVEFALVPGGIMSLHSGSNLALATSLEPIPPVWENKTLRIAIESVGSQAVNIEYSKNLSIYSAVNRDGRFFLLDTDAYSFCNCLETWDTWDAKLKDFWAGTKESLSPLTGFVMAFGQWNGRCFGMALTSSLYFTDSTFKPVDKSTHDMELYEEGVVDDIMRHHYSQLLNVSDEGRLSAQVTSDKLKAILEDGKAPILAMRDPEFGHAVTVFRLIIDESEDRATAYIYENGIPEEAQLATNSLDSSVFVYKGGSHRWEAVDVLPPYHYPSNAEFIAAVGDWGQEFVADLWSDGMEFLGLASPAVMQVTDTMGRRMAVETDGTEINEIPGAEIQVVEELNGHRYVAFYIPMGLEYDVSFTGTDEGVMTIERVQPESESVAKIRRFEDVPVKSGTVATMTSEDLALSIDQDADGVAEEQVGPSVVETIGPDLPIVPPWDINGDGMVDIVDLVAVGSAFGTSGDGVPADVNGDGIVDIVDLVTVGTHFGEQTSGVSAAPRLPGSNDADVLAEWLAQAHATDDGSPLFRRGIAVLEQLLNAIVPQETALLPNYPNPFNPETWIPYQLSKAAEVTITFYDATGRLVKRLEIGQQSAGIYHTRERASYWDGRNEAGEPAASGTYMVELRAGEYRRLRQLVLLK